MYKAKNVDTEKALKAYQETREYQQQEHILRIEKEKSYYEGIQKGLDIGESIFHCSNYEKEKALSYEDGICDFIYELGKEMDILTEDIRNNIKTKSYSCEDAVIAIKNRIQTSDIPSEEN